MPRSVISNPALSPRRQFIRAQTGKGVIGLLLCGLYGAIIGEPDLAAALVFAAVTAPLGLAGLGFSNLSLKMLEACSVAVNATLLSLLVLFTGGLSSAFLVWMVLLPFEGALIGRRTAVVYSGGVAFAGFAVVALIELAGFLPVSRLQEAHNVLVAGALLVAIAQACAMAIAAQERRQAADAAIEASEARYRFLAESALDLITLHDLDGRIRFASHASNALLGYPPEDLTGVQPSSLCHPDDVQTVANIFADARSGKPATAELRLKSKKGTHVWCELRCRTVRGDVIAVTRDITRRKAHERALIHARDQAEEASRAKSRFLANMSHELRTPLNAIIGFSEVMVQEFFGPLGSARYLEYTRLIHESGSHLLELINAILDMSKIEAGRFTITPEKFELDEVLAQALGIVKLQAQRHGVVLSHDIAPEVRYVMADKRAILQILINLLSNGIKYTQANGRVWVNARAVGGALQITVADTGVGISEEDLQRLGQPFEQVENEYTRSKEGTGLGLALVRALADLHGGKMTIESALGEGTCVKITLPEGVLQTEALDDAAMELTNRKLKIG